MVEAAVAGQLETLGLAAALRLGLVEGEGEADPLDGLRGNAVQHAGRGDPADLVDASATRSTVTGTAGAQAARARAEVGRAEEQVNGLRVPPKWLATCLVHWNGVFIACAQDEGKWLKCLGPPPARRWP